MNALELPAGADPARDHIIGRDELGRVIRRTMIGAAYTTGEGYASRPSAKSLFDVIAEPSRLMAGGGANMATTQAPQPGMQSQGAGPVGGLLGGIWDAISIPGKAARGQEPTLGGLLDLASMVQLGGAAMPAPKGALRSGAMREATTEAQSKADEVLQLLKSGRGSEVTDDMLSAADQQYLWANYDLPMDAASRMDRARGMGFDTETPLYHGTDTSFHSFKPSKNGNWGEGVYFAHDPSIASDFALEKSSSMNYGGDPRILTVVSKGKYPSVNSETFTGSERGFDANLRGGVKYRIVPDPSNIRSRFARFDPRLSHLANLSAIGAGGAYLGGLLGFNPVTGLPYESDQ